MTEGIPVNRQVLIWARKRAGYTVEDLIKKYPKLQQWEDEKSFPSFSQLESLGQKYKIPIAVFFFSSPPNEISIEKSLRAVSEDEVHNLTPHMRYLFRKAKAFQIYLNELWVDDQKHQLERIKWLSEGTKKSSVNLAQFVRKILDVSIEKQLEWKTVDEALDTWRDILAKHGIYVFKDAFKNDRISGFCIYDDLFPIIYINNSMSKSRQIFTIFHELAHLIFKQNYLDILENDNCFPEKHSSNNIEVKCNAFAGNFLVPDDDFKNRCNETFSEDLLTSLTEIYKISKEVILRKFLDHNLITGQFFNKKMKEWAEYAEKQKTKIKSKAGGNYYLTKLQYLGDSYFSLVFSQYHQGRIDIDRASSYLDVKPKIFSGLEETFLKREVS